MPIYFSYSETQNSSLFLVPRLLFFQDSSFSSTFPFSVNSGIGAWAIALYMLYASMNVNTYAGIYTCYYGSVNQPLNPKT